MVPERALSIGRPINLPIFVVGLTNEIAAAASESDTDPAMQHFSDCLIAYDFLDQFRNKNTFLKMAVTDISDSVNNLIAQTPTFGASKWASLQATEKYLKACIEIQGLEFPKTHNLKKLADRLSIDDDSTLKKLELIQCNASVRYGDEPVTRMEAFIAHLETVKIILTTANQFRESKETESSA